MMDESATWEMKAGLRDFVISDFTREGLKDQGTAEKEKGGARSRRMGTPVPQGSSGSWGSSQPARKPSQEKA